MCKTPKIIWMTSKGGVKHRLVVPCGNCVDCQNSKRAQLVARCKYEYKDNSFVYFITFTYTDFNLVKLYYRKDYIINRRDFIVRHLQQVKGKVFAYDRFLLNKDHAKELVVNIRQFFKRKFLNLFPKYYLTGEYGKISHRPHLHALLFFNKSLQLDYLKTTLQNLWKKGNVDVEVANDACINYVAKHQVKQDDGSKFQRKLAPIFFLQSHKIGLCMKDDPDVISNWNKHLRFGRIPNTPYKYALPRYIVKYYKPEGYNDDELHEMEVTGYRRLQETLSMQGVDLKHVDNFIRTNKDFYHYIQSEVKKDFNEKLTYKINKFNEKYLLWKRKGNNDTDLV